MARALFPQLAVIGKALASPQRLMLVDLLCQGPRSVEGLAEQSGMSIANTSQHLQLLKGAMLVDSERQGQRIVYRLATDDVASFYVAFRNLAASRLAELDRVMRDLVRPHGPADTEGILTRIQRGVVTLLDVRPSEEFEAGHLPGALSIPVTELPKRLREIPRNRDVVAYCRGPFCTMAEEAVEFLRHHGVNAVALDLGIVELRKRFRIETGGARHVVSSTASTSRVAPARPAKKTRQARRKT